MISIHYSPGFQAFILEAGDLRTQFDDNPSSIEEMLSWLRRRAIRAALRDRPEGLTQNELDRLIDEWLGQGGQVKGKIKRINLEELGL